MRVIRLVIAAVLLVALVVIGIGKISGIIFYVEKPKTPGYSVEIEQVASKGVDFFNSVIRKVMDEGTLIREEDKIKTFTHPERSDVMVDVNMGDGTTSVYFDTDEGTRAMGQIGKTADETTKGRTVEELYEAEEIYGPYGKEEQEGIKAAIQTHHHSILRNKKALMIYLNERVKRIQSLRWTLGVGLPDSISENLSHSERDYFTEYSKILNKYMGKKEGINMNLILDRDPPKEHKVQVRCTKDHGVIYFKDGVVDLKKDSVHLLRREEAQPLISEGVLEKLDDT